jgi:hypothetical protein
MSPKAILVSSSVGLSALGLLWAALAVRGEREPKEPKSLPKPATVRRAPAPEAPTEPYAAVAYRPAAPRVASAPEAEGDYRVIEERVRRLEEKLLALETKRTALSTSNQDLERQLSERAAELSARAMAEWRIRMWESLLGLSDTQKRALLELWTAWGKEDGGRPAGPDTWLSRESELRSRLSVEQTAKLHVSAVTQSQQLWGNLGRSIGSMVGASADEATRYQQLLGDFRAPNAMLLPEGYGADWPGMLREGASRLQPVLSSDQMAKLGRFMPK